MEYQSEQVQAIDLSRRPSEKGAATNTPMGPSDRPIDKVQLRKQNEEWQVWAPTFTGPPLPSAPSQPNSNMIMLPGSSASDSGALVQRVNRLEEQQRAAANALVMGGVQTSQLRHWLHEQSEETRVARQNHQALLACSQLMEQKLEGLHARLWQAEATLHHMDNRLTATTREVVVLKVRMAAMERVKGGSKSCRGRIFPDSSDPKDGPGGGGAVAASTAHSLSTSATSCEMAEV